MTFTRRDIIDYYENSEISFKLVWDLNYSLAIHSVTLYNQFKALKTGLWQYGVFYAEK